MGSQYSITIRFGSTRYRALVDTKAEVSVNNYSVDYALTPRKKNLNTTNGSIPKMEVFTNLQVKIGQHLTPHVFFAVKIETFY